ncbi:MAG: hypothetical protein QNJ78_00145 [Gammaproteobacteria bacterium]|nr:hypothetical protein [Gammaproteobacteria bacterium]
MQKEVQPLPVNIPQYVYPEDEVSLVDIWLVILEHKNVFWKVFFITLILGFIVALIIPIKYSITSTIDIGQTIRDDQVILLESAESVKAKLENALVPKILIQYDDEDIRLTEFDITIPKNSDLVLITTEVEEDQVSQFEKIVTQMAQAIEQDHERILRPIRASIRETILQKELELQLENDQRIYEPIIKDMESKLKGEEVNLAKLEDPTIHEHRIKALEIQIDNEKSQLESLKERGAILNSKKERLNQLSDLLIYQIAELKEQIKRAIKVQQGSVSDAKSSEQGMTMLMIDNELQQNRTRLSSLEERLYIDLENQHADLQKEINDNNRDQIQQTALIDEKEKNLKKFLVEHRLNVEKQKTDIITIKAQKLKIPAEREQKIAVLKQEIINLNERLENILETQSVAEPMRSQEPVGLTKIMLFAFAIVLAGFIAVMSTFIIQFRSKVQSQLAESK